jgi:hypothetical protein
MAKTHIFRTELGILCSSMIFTKSGSYLVYGNHQDNSIERYYCFEVLDIPGPMKTIQIINVVDRI